MATVTKELDILAAQLHSTAIPELVKIDGTNFPVWGYAFDAAADEQISFRLFANNYGSGSVTALLDFYSRTGQTTGNAVLGCALACVTPGDAQSMETDGLATENTATQAINGTARGPTRATVTISNLDSLAANDSVELRVRRLGSNGSDTLTGDLILFGVTLQYSDT